MGIDQVSAHDHSSDSAGGEGIVPNQFGAQEVISEADDLPDPSGGTHPLEPMTAYLFDSFITSDFGLELAPGAALMGYHGGVSGFIHTGGNTALVGTDADHLMRDMYVHAPGGTLYDLTATQDQEMLVESCSFSDAIGMGDMASLGTVSGFRAPSWKGVNFENFQTGLTLDGTPDKIFFEGCPMRGISAAGVTILTFADTLDVDIVDMSNNYVKGVQADTEVVRAGAGATPNDIFQYRGTTHDSAVTLSNILNGEAGDDVVGYRVRDSYPLPDSRVAASYTLDSVTTTTINTQAASKLDGAAYERVAGTTTAENGDRVNQTDNSIEYIGRRVRYIEVSAVLSVGTGNDNELAAAWFRNGNLIPGSTISLTMNGQAGGIDKQLTTVGIVEDFTTGDTVDVRVANLDSTTDITVADLNTQLSEA